MASSQGQRSASVERMAGFHLGDVGRRMQRIALLERPAEALGQGLGQRGLADAGDAHHHQHRRLGAHAGAPRQARQHQRVDRLGEAVLGVGRRDRAGVGLHRCRGLAHGDGETGDAEHGDVVGHVADDDGAGEVGADMAGDRPHRLALVGAAGG